MTSTRTKFEHWLIGSATSVLKEAFINRDLNDDSTDLTALMEKSKELLRESQLTTELSSAQRQMKRIVDQYQKLLKNRSLNQPKANREEKPSSKLVSILEPQV